MIRPQVNTNLIRFSLFSELVISTITIQDDLNETVGIEHWTSDYTNKVEAYSGMEFVVTSVSILGTLLISNVYKLHVEYSIKPEAIEGNVGDDLLRTVVSKQAIRGIGWPSGLIPIIYDSSRYAAPHSVSIRHPNAQSCMSTGNKVSDIQEGEYTIETFHSQRVNPTPPSFACDEYQVLEKSKEGITVEFFTFIGDHFPAEILDTLLDTILLFKSEFGDTYDRHFQFGFVDVINSQYGGTSRGNVIFMRYPDLSNIESNFKERVLFFANLLHEIGHNWNGFVLGDDWRTNKYFLWYQEGGANFLASWALDRIMGHDAGNIYRKNNLERYEQFKGYSSQHNLKTIPYTFLVDIPDIMIAYEYAGMVWEQLSLKIGNETLLNGLTDFLQNYWFNENFTTSVTIEDLFQSFEKFTSIDVETYLDQWGLHNPQITLRIVETKTEMIGDLYQTNVTIEINSDIDFEIFSSIDYTVGFENQMYDVHFVTSGIHSVIIQTNQKPSAFIIDPEYRVPRMGFYHKPDDDRLVTIIARTSVLALLIILLYLLYKGVKRL